MRRKISDALSVMMVFGVLIAGILAVSIQLENYKRSKGLTHYDRVQMDRLVNQID